MGLILHFIVGSRRDKPTIEFDPKIEKTLKKNRNRVKAQRTLQFDQEEVNSEEGASEKSFEEDWENQGQQKQFNNQAPQNSQRQTSFPPAQPPQKQPNYLEDALTKLTINTNSFMDETRASLRNQEASIRNLDKSARRLHLEVGKEQGMTLKNKNQLKILSPHLPKRKKNSYLSYSN
ncbi:hypothetical protein PIB30_060732 [Stylosanthes scabra]|uniref:t-SNARE coiled-coil homology domain-containing protein n=1 Tax=Stylosanthes scabra TaxID=79078 RepID=A0ABU6QLC7_9FABA|nr:hypothetical protein [Stylosanthes scabra]